MYLIDTHCHLNFQAFDNQVPDIVRRAKRTNVGKIIIPGTDIESSKKAVKIAQTYDNCWAAVGIHPHHAQDPNLVINNELRHQLEELLSQNRVVAIGEIGLDNYLYTKTKYNDSNNSQETKLKQKELLKMQLDLAVIHNVPAILHCREAYDEMTQTISNNSRIRENLHGVFHCFTGSTRNLQVIIAMGYYVGFDGNITYSRSYSTLVSCAPLDRILLETDSPYLTPHPFRGQRNEPKHLNIVAETIAKYRTTSSSEIAAATTKNAEKLFNI